MRRRQYNRCNSSSATIAILWAAWLLALPAVASAQTIRGTVTEELTGRALTDAEIIAIDSAGTVVATTASLEGGDFALATLRDGTFRLQVLLPGYVEVLTPWIPVSGSHTLLAIELLPEPVVIDGISVTVDAETRFHREVANAGVTIEDLGRRFVDEAGIDRRSWVGDVGEILMNQGIAGVRMIRDDNAAQPTAGDDFLCVTQIRGKRGNAKDRCGLIVLDGRIVTPDVASLIPVTDLAAVAVLTPMEATLVYGTFAGGGAVLLFTKTGEQR